MYKLVIVISEDRALVKDNFMTSGSASEWLARFLADAEIDGREYDTAIISAQIIRK